MNGFIKKTLVGFVVGGSAVSLAGCQCYRDRVDPVYPQRYDYMARNEVLEPLLNQQHNGHILDQTVWNYFFETDLKGQPTDKLNAYGLEHLTYLTRRRPNPDPKVYLQTSHDLAYNPAEPPEANAQARAELDAKRMQAVHKFLTARTAGRHLGYDFVIAIHDPAEVGISATAIGGNTPPLQVQGAVPRLYSNFQGILPANAGGGFGTPGAGGGMGGGGGGAGGGTGTGGGGY
jgi:hypothetical protein